MSSIVECQNCGKEFDKIYPSKIKKYCSKKCLLESKSKKVKWITFTCEFCGKEFQRLRRLVVSSENKGIPIKYCSRKCKSDAWGVNQVEGICPVCGKKFMKQARYKNQNTCCSPQCSAKNPKNSCLDSHKKIDCICVNCGKEFKRHISSMKNHVTDKFFCTQTCFNEYRLKNPISKYEKRIYSVCAKEYIDLKENEIMKCKSCIRKDENMNKKITVYCKNCNAEIKVSQSMKNRKFCNMQCKKEYNNKTKDTYEKLSHALRTSSVYYTWRENVFKNANFQCEKCGDAKNKFNAHHKQSLYNICKEMNFIYDDIIKSEKFNDVSNGACLCIKCHSEEHPYDKRLINKLGQFCRRDSMTV